MLKKLFYFLIVAMVMVGINPIAHAQTSIGINPSRIKLDVKQGQTYQKEITVYNQGNKDYGVKSYARDYRSKGKVNTFKTINKDWVKIKPARFNLKPQETKKIKIDINIEDAAGAKNKNIVVFFEPQAKGGGVSVIQRVGTILALSIKPVEQPAILPYFLLFGTTMGLALVFWVYRKKLVTAVIINIFIATLIIVLAGVQILVFPPGKARANPGTRTKTIEYFVGQDNTAGGVAAGADTTFNFSVYLPDIISSPTAIKSVWVDYSFNNASTDDTGPIDLGLTPQGQSESVFTATSYPVKAVNTTLKVRADYTSTIAGFIQAPGTYNFSFRANVSGVPRKAENAKIFITYDYDDAAATQLRTVRYYLGQENGNTALNSTATFNLGAPGLPEDSVTVRSAWSEVRASIVATNKVDSTIEMWYDSDSASTYHITNGGRGSQPVNLLHKKNITDAAHTFNVRPTTGYPLTLVGAEQVITYSFNYANSTKLLKTMEILLGSDGAKASAATLNANKAVEIPENGVLWKSIYLKGSAHAAADSSFRIAAQLNSPPTPATTATYDFNRETLGNFWYLSNETNNLSTMTTGANNIYSSWAISSGGETSRSVLAILTYEYDKGTTDENASASYFVGQETALGAITQPNFNVAIAGSPTVTGSHLWVNSFSGKTRDGTFNTSVQPTATTAYNWDSTGEYLLVSTYHDNTNNEITGAGAYTANFISNLTNVMSGVVTVNWQYPGASVPPSLTLTIDETYDINGTLDSVAPFAVGFGTTDPLSQPTYTVRQNNGEYAIKFTVQSNVKWEMPLEASDDLKDTGGNIIPIADLKIAEDGSGTWTSFVKTPSSFLLRDEEPSTPSTSFNYDYRLENIDLDVDAGVGPYSTTTIYSLLESTQAGAG